MKNNELVSEHIKMQNGVRMMDKLTALREFFGYSSFREGQEKLIDAVLAGRDAFGVMPTGGGKSICYQIPALLLPGVTIVVSPLISLMQDQVAALKTAGIPAAYLNSSLTPEQMQTVLHRAREGRYKLIYVAPERLETAGFQRLVEAMPVSLVAVDEAHCISQWGQDFRPSYLKILDFLKLLKRRPAVAAFTATATEAVREDVVRILELRDPMTVVTGFDRPNLRFAVQHPQNKNAALDMLLAARRGQSGIIYCATRKKTEEVCEHLCGNGYAATRYHAGLDEEERRRNQEDFVYDRVQIVAATNAFGMGIDKSDVRFVIHYNLPLSVEAYYQEAGRAGRDGDAADCILLYSASDVRTAHFLIENGEENELLSPEERELLRERDLRRLGQMIGYCKTDGCLRGYLLDYFGQSHPAACGNCSNCLTETESVDITREAQMILSCVKRIETALGYPLGAVMVIRTLRGSRDRRIPELGLDRLPTYGLLRELPQQKLRMYLERLEKLGYLAVEQKHQIIKATEKANAVLFRGENVQIAMPKAAKVKKRNAAKLHAQADPTLFDTLRALRRDIANEEGVPAFVVFSDATLRDMAAKRPRTPGAMLDVTGVGRYKLQKYGDAFLKRIAESEE